MGKGTGNHILVAERTNLTTPVSTLTAAYVNNTNNGRLDVNPTNGTGELPFDGTMYDAYFGVFTG